MGTYKKSEQTKEIILETAKQLFLAKGFTATTVRDICQGSNLSISRINYHFSSKDELAAIICRQFLQNFYEVTKKILGNRRGYSLVSEAIFLRFLVELLIDDEHKYEASVFYRDIAMEGIFANVFTGIDQQLFTNLLGKENANSAAKLGNKIGIYSNIFASSIPAVCRSWSGTLKNFNGDTAAAKSMIQDVFSGLFMQMMDMPHEAQKAMVDMASAYYRLLDIEMTSLTDVKIKMTSSLTLRQKVEILEPTIDKNLKLKSTEERSSIEIDTDNHKEPQ